MGRRARSALLHASPRLRRPVAVAVGVVIAYAFLILGGAFDGTMRATLGTLVGTLTAYVAAGLALAAGRAQASRRARLSWTLLGLGLLCWGLGDTVRGWSVLVRGAAPGVPSLADVGYLAMLPLTFAGIVLRPQPQPRAIGRWLLLVDTGLMLCVLVAVGWSLVLGPAFEQRGTDPLVQALTLAYPVGLLGILCCLTIAVLREGEHRPATVLLLPALVAAAVAASADAVLLLRGSGALGHPVDVLWFASLVLCGLAAAVERAEPVEAQPPPTGVGGAWRFLVPSVLVAGATLLVWTVALQRGGAREGTAQVAIGTAWLLLLGRVYLEYRAVKSAHGRERQLRISHAGSFRREQQRRRQLETVRNLTAELTRELDLPALLSLITQRAASLLETPIGASLLWDASAGALVPRAWHGLGSWFGAVRLRPGEDAVGRAVQLGHGVIVNDYTSARETFRPLLFHTTVTAALATPIMSLGRPLGAIVVADSRPGRTFDNQDLSLLELLADQAAIAIEHAQLVDQAAASEALRELAHLKTELLSTVSHELRTPLTLIHGYAELLRVRADALTPADITMMADEILSGSRTMIRLVDDLLDFSRLDSSRIHLDVERVDVAAMLDRHVKSWHGQAGSERLRLDVDTPLEGLVDPARLHQIVRNLVANALIYAPYGPIYLRGAHEPGWVRLEVVDQGPGIPADELPRVWETFFRGEGARNSPNRGSGLGLAVVKQLVELHGGHVDVESVPGHGTTFRVWLPAAPGGSLPAAAPTPAASAVVH